MAREIFWPEGYVLNVLRNAVARFPTLKAAAAHYGVSLPYLCDVLAGRRALTNRLANQVGFERKVVFVSREPEATGGG